MTISREIIATLSSAAPGRHVLAALERVLVEDAYLLKVDANERSICYRFGMYLQGELPQYHVDCEYNRDGIDPKRIGHLALYPEDDDAEGKTVFPDIIVHIRGEQNNYLVVEIKKTSSRVDRATDLKKLRGYKSDENLSYEFALFVELEVGNCPGISHAEWI